MKRLISLLIVSALILGCFAACSSETSSSGASSSAADTSVQADSGAEAGDSDKLVIAHSTRAMGDDAFQTMLEASIREEVENRGAEYILLTVDSITDVSGQANQIENLINMNVDGIIVNPCDAITSLEALKMAQDKGIEVIIVDGRLEDGYEDRYITQVGAANVACGEMAAQALLELRPEGGNFICVRGINGNGVLDTRTDVFKATLEGTVWNCVGDMNNATSDNEGAMTIVENMMAAASYDVDIVFAAADSWFPGINQALESANMTDQVKLIGIDGSNLGCSYIENGQCIAACQVNVQAIGKASVDILLSVLNGETTKEDYEPIFGVDPVIVTEENLAEALTKAF